MRWCGRSRLRVGWCLDVTQGSREKAARKETGRKADFMSELKLRPPRRCVGKLGRRVGIEQRSFVAKGTPLDDGQKRFGGRTKRLGEADRKKQFPRCARDDRLCEDGKFAPIQSEEAGRKKHSLHFRRKGES